MNLIEMAFLIMLHTPENLGLTAISHPGECKNIGYALFYIQVMESNSLICGRIVNRRLLIT